MSLRGSVALSLTNQNLLVNRLKGLVDFAQQSGCFEGLN